jgi:hypothetical protein
MKRHPDIRRRGGYRILAFLVSMVAGCTVVAADDFHFSTEAEKARISQEAAEQKRAEAIRTLVSVPCRQSLKNRRIVQLIAEQTVDQWLTDQGRYSSFFTVLDSRMQALGLKTYSQQQIREGIARAEIDAYFRNDPDAALAASKRLGADFVLRGSISTRIGVNPVVQVQEVAVNIELTLSTAGGRVLSTVDAHTDSYSGNDTQSTALALVREQADQLVARLYNDFCRQAGK